MKYNYESFTDEQIEEILQNIKDGFYDILVNYKYGEYMLDIAYENNNEITVIIYDDNGHGEIAIEIDKFIDTIEKGEFEKYLNELLYYRYHEVD